MLILQIKNENIEKVIFDYFPEGKEIFGTLEMDRKTGKIEVLKIADNDEMQMYLHKAMSKMLSFFENRRYEKRTVIAWY